MTPRATRVRRRALSITLYVLAFLLLTAGFVPLFAVLLLFDLVRSQGLVLSRALVFFVWYLACELVGIVASAAIWLASLRAGSDPDRFVDRNFELQRCWARMLGRGGFRIFGIRLDVEEHGYRFGERPVLVFVRHASTADTILAALLISVPYGTHLRYVLKRELLWDPCLDIVGNRLPNVFLSREASQSEQEIAAVRKLAIGLGPDDGVLIYPEGTRFSAARKERAIARLREQGRFQAAREAEQLRFVLPPRPGGALALVEEAAGADVLFLAHTGFEGSASFDRFFNGGLIGKTVHVRIDVVRSEEIPSGRPAQTEWLMQHWRAMDRFIESHQPGGAPRRSEDEPARLRLVR